MLTIPFVDKSLTFFLYVIHNLPLYHPILQKSFHYDLHHKYFSIRSSLRYITFPNDHNVLSCIVLAGHFCMLDAALHPVDETQDCMYFLFENNKKKIYRYSRKVLLNQPAD